MSITAELEKLVKLRDQGDLTVAEFEQAKSLLLADTQVGSNTQVSESLETEAYAKVIQSDRKRETGKGGMWFLAGGVFIGNFIIVTIMRGDAEAGFIIALIAAVISVLLSYILSSVKIR